MAHQSPGDFVAVAEFHDLFVAQAARVPVTAAFQIRHRKLYVVDTVKFGNLGIHGLHLSWADNSTLCPQAAKARVRMRMRMPVRMAGYPYQHKAS
jgi:hypothetical protein